MIYISEIFNSSLTTVKQDIYIKGQKAVEMLLKSIFEESNVKQEVVLPVEIAIRETVKNTTVQD